MDTRRWQRAIDQQIEEAKKQGKFDNLPGKGKPLDLSENPFEDPETRTAFRLLKDNGFAPAWIEDRKDIEAGWEKSKTMLIRGWMWYQGKIEEGDNEPWIREEWNRTLARFREQVDDLNTKIRAYNVQVPSARFERLFIDPEKYIQKVKQGKLE